MKNLISFLTLLLFILTISHNLFSAEANDGVSPDPVLDVDGNELQTGTKYYMLSSLTGSGVTVYPFENRTCTSVVAQVRTGQGLPVVFGNGGKNLEEVIHESTDLRISFASNMFICSTDWKVDRYYETAGNRFVVANFTNPNIPIVNNRFQIRNNPSLGGYSLVFCPSLCTDVGIYFGYDRISRYSLKPFNTPPFALNFKKAC